MKQKNIFIMLLLCSIWLIRAEDITLSGTVKNSGVGIAGAKISLVKYPGITARTKGNSLFYRKRCTALRTVVKSPKKFHYRLGR